MLDLDSELSLTSASWKLFECGQFKEGVTLTTQRNEREELSIGFELQKLTGVLPSFKKEASPTVSANEIKDFSTFCKKVYEDYRNTERSCLSRLSKLPDSDKKLANFSLFDEEIMEKGDAILVALAKVLNHLDEHKSRDALKNELSETYLAMMEREEQLAHIERFLDAAHRAQKALAPEAAQQTRKWSPRP